MFHPATDDLIKFLNELLALDRKAVTHLVETRTICNERLTSVVSVQTILEENRAGGSKRFTVGFLGLLNGFCGFFPDGPRQGWGPITAVMTADGLIDRFIKTENQ